MADWKSTISRFAQNAATKGKEVVETTRLNVEVGSAEQKVKKAHADLGAYIAEHPELLNLQDETAAGLLKAVEDNKEELAKLKQNLQDVRNVNICAACGAEVSRDSKFCGKCGAPVDRSILDPTVEVRTCPDCGAPLEEDSVFCANCGKKLD